MKAHWHLTASLWSKRAALCALLLLAFALRLYWLEGQSLWADEGNSVAMAPRALGDILQRAANDIHPPLYYIALHYWTALVGTSVFALRALSVFYGVAAVAFTAWLGSGILTGQRTSKIFVAWLATFLLTISPFAIYYSQETRMYMQVLALGAASWGAWLVWDKQTLNRWAVAYWLITLALLYSHYYAASLVIAQNMAWVVALKDGRTALSRRFLLWVAVQGTLLLAYAPWLWFARETILNWPSISADLTIGFLAQEVFRIFTLGLANEGLPLWVGVLIGVCLGVGVVAALRMRNGYVALLYFLVPPALMLLLSLDRPFWNPKFLLVALPGYYLLLALGVGQLGGWLQRAFKMAWGVPVMAGAAALLFATAMLPTLMQTYHAPRYARDDYRGMVRTIVAQATANDAIILDGAGQREVFDYYYQGAAAVYGLPATQPLDVAATEATLSTIAATHGQLWVLWWAEQEGDPALVIPRWLDANAFEAGSRWYGNVRLARYLLGDAPALTETEVPFTTADSANTLTLVGVGTEPTTLTAGDVLALYSQWESSPPLPPLVFFAQILDSNNRVIGQYDGDGGAPPTEQWTADAPLTLRMGLPIPVGTVPGEYRVIMGAYQRDTGQRLSTATGDAYSVTTLRINPPTVPPPVDAITLPNGQRHADAFGTLGLVVSQVNKLGFDHDPAAPLRAGDPLSVLLYWQIQSAEAALPTLQLRLTDAGNTSYAEWSLTPTDNTYPLELWRKDDLIRDPHTYFLPPDLPVGDYTLTLTDGVATITIRTLTITP